MQAAQQNSGFTLVELMVTVAVLAILVGIAIPSFQGTLDKRRIIGAAEQIYADLQYARSEAIRQNKSVTVHFRNAGTNTTWCYGMNVHERTVSYSGACDCTTTTSGAENSNCTVRGLTKTVYSTDYRGISLTAASFSGTSGTTFTTFTPLRGIGAAGTPKLRSASDFLVEIVVSPQGRIRPCSPPSSGSTYYLSNYPTC